jgi:putative membrane protein
MSRRFIAMAGSGLALVLAAAPLGVLHSQVTNPGTNPRQRTDTTTPPTTTQPTTPQGAAAPTQEAITAEMRNDLPFIREAASANLMEIHLGQLAQSKASNSSVKQFGQRMVTDHARLEQQLTSMLSRNGIGFNPELSSEHQEKVTRLQNLSGQQFDQAYMSIMIQDHQTDIGKFEEQSRSADSPQVRDLATNSLPVLQQHLTLAQQVGGQVNAQPVTAAAGNQAGQVSADIKADEFFIRENTQDNYLEVLAGRLAEKKAQNSAVKDFAQRMDRDHNRFQDEWVRMATQNGLTYKAGMGKVHRAKLKKLEKLSGRAFDRAYMNMMLEDHKGYIGYLEKEGRAAHSAAVRQIAESELPTLREHFAEAKRIGAQVGANTNVSLRSEKEQK